MSKKCIAPSPTSPSKPQPTIHFELPDGLPKNLPDVESSVSLVVRGKLLKIAAKDGDYEFPCLTLRPDSVTLKRRP